MTDIHALIESLKRAPQNPTPDQTITMCQHIQSLESELMMHVRNCAVCRGRGEVQNNEFDETGATRLWMTQCPHCKEARRLLGEGKE